MNAQESPDGRSLFYARGGNAPGLFELRLDGPLPAEGRSVLKLQPGFLGHWALGRNGIYFIEPTTDVTGYLSRLRLLDPASGSIRELAPLSGIPSAFDGGMAISP